MSDDALKSKRIAKNTILLYIRMLFLLFVNLYASRVILQALGVEDYGIYNIVGGFVLMFSMISAPLTSSCSRFLNYEMGKGDKEKVQKVFSTAVTVHIALAILIVLLCEIIGSWYINNYLVFPSNRLFAAKICFQFSIFNFCTNLITIPYNAAIIANERMNVYAYVSVFEGIAKLLVCFLIIFSPYDKLIVYGLLLLIIQITVRLIYQFYCRKHFPEAEYSFIIDRNLIGQMFSYSSWQFIGHSSRVLENHGVNLLLNSFFGPILNASRGISTQVLGTVEGFANNFMIAMNPQITQSYAEGNLCYMFKLIYNGSRFSFYLLSIISLPIIINADFLLNLWLNEVPDYAVTFVRLSLIGSLIASLSNPLITAQNATGKIRNYQIAIGGTRLLNLPLCYVLLKLSLDAISVMAVSILIEILCLSLRLYIIPIYIPEFKSKLFIQKVILPCITVIFIAIIVPLFVEIYKNESVSISIINLFISFFSSLTAILLIGCSRSERMLVISKALNFVRKHN